MFHNRQPFTGTSLLTEAARRDRWIATAAFAVALAYATVRYNVLKLLPFWQLTFDPQNYEPRSRSAGPVTTPTAGWRSGSSSS